MLFTLLLALLATAALSMSTGEELPSRWDNVDVGPILKNERLLKTYFKCLMDQGKCSPDAAELKKHVRDVLANDCSSCTEKQRLSLDKVMRHLHQHKPQMYQQLEEKYDPEGNYRAKNLQPQMSSGN